MSNHMKAEQIDDPTDNDDLCLHGGAESNEREVTWPSSANSSVSFNDSNREMKMSPSSQNENFQEMDNKKSNKMSLRGIQGSNNTYLKPSESASSAFIDDEHMTGIKGTKKYTCTVCDYVGEDEDTWKTHIRSHCADKPYSCTSCDERFKSALSLDRHDILVHSKEKPYSCTECDNKFK